MNVITGATGMLGAHLLWYLVQENKDVLALKRPNSDTEATKWVFRYYGDADGHFYQKINWIDGDIENLESLKRAFQGAEYVYHCAAVVNLGKGGEQLMRSNVGGTKNVLAAALACSVKKLCFVSSIAALSIFPKGESTDETEKNDFDLTQSPYGRSKRLAEQHIRNHAGDALEYIIVNPGVILGYSRKMSGSGELFKRVKTGLPFYTEGMTGYVGAEDVARIMVLLMNSKIHGERFVVTENDYLHKEILSQIADGYGKFRPFIPVNKILLIVVASVVEFLGKLFRFTPLLDRRTIRTAISSNRYNHNKLLQTLPGFQFTSVDKIIKKICDFELRGN